MTQRTRPSLGGLLTKSQLALQMSQTTFGELFGVSRGTIARWQGGGLGRLLPTYLVALVKAVHPVDAALASELALEHGQTLDALGVATIAPRDPPRRVSTVRLVDTVVCAAADVVGQSPAAIRPTLRAAFERAKEMGLSVDDVLDGLRDAAKT